MKVIDIPVKFILLQMSNRKILTNSLIATLGVRQLELTTTSKEAQVLLSPGQVALVKDQENHVRLSIRKHSTVELLTYNNSIITNIPGAYLQGQRKEGYSGYINTNSSLLLVTNYQFDDLKVLADANRSLSVLIL